MIAEKKVISPEADVIDTTATQTNSDDFSERVMKIMNDPVLAEICERRLPNSDSNVDIEQVLQVARTNHHANIAALNEAGKDFSSTVST